jgi:glutamate-ammonia-ligase adenylyltransferase
MSLQLTPVPNTLSALAERIWERMEPIWLTLDDASKQSALLNKDAIIQVGLGSDFVVEQCERHPDWLQTIVTEHAFEVDWQELGVHQSVAKALEGIKDEASLMVALRTLRNQWMIRIIWRDLLRVGSMEQTVRELSWMADALIDGALNNLYDQLTERFGIPMGEDPMTGEKTAQRMVVIGMGKLGAYELNLSSDIDLMFTFQEKGKTEGARRSLDNQEFFIRLGQRLIHALDTLNSDGFVFRVDMRLRPFGSASPLAISFAAMEMYYQDQGREWERYAMIKARIVAGDKEAGQSLLQELRPFVYRKYLDYSAFESLREMKEMINREVRRKGMEANVKLGPGGIREVEFIAQAFQLIRGGRDTRLQQRSLQTILPLLPDCSDMTEGDVAELNDAYVFLRNAEHVIQAIADKQTQMLPSDELNQARIAFSMGFADWDSFTSALTQHRNNVRAQFEQVIEPAKQDTQDHSNDQEWLMLWSEALSEEEAHNWLHQCGYDDPELAYRQIRDLHQSRTVQMMQASGLDRLKRLLPSLLEEVGKVSNATQTLERVFQLIQAVLRRSAYLVLLNENPGALQQLVKLCSSSAWFAEQLATKPVLLDELIDPRTLYSPPDKQALQDDLRQQLLRIPEEDIEQIMEALRYFKSAHLLKVAAADITGVLPLMKVSDYLTWLAEVILDSVLDVAWRIMVEKHGYPQYKEGVLANPNFIVVGYGKLGGIELSYGSDLDLVFIHNCEPDRVTQGEKSIPNSVFFTRLGQRMIHILNTFTAGGQLYEVDMRLRPSGNSGLLVSSLSAFKEYQQKDAWTWEHQALVRARVVAGDTELTQAFNELRADILMTHRDHDTLRKEVIEMREKMRNHLGSSSKDAEEGVFDIKQDAGGIVDIEFMVQYMVLAYAHGHESLVTYSDNIRILDALEAECIIEPGIADTLRETYKHYRAMGHRSSMQAQTTLLADAEVQEVRAEIQHIWQDLMALNTDED